MKLQLNMFLCTKVLLLLLCRRRLRRRHRRYSHDVSSLKREDEMEFVVKLWVHDPTQLWKTEKSPSRVAFLQVIFPLYECKIVMLSKTFHVLNLDVVTEDDVFDVVAIRVSKTKICQSRRNRCENHAHLSEEVLE